MVCKVTKLVYKDINIGFRLEFVNLLEYRTDIEVDASVVVANEMLKYYTENIRKIRDIYNDSSKGLNFAKKELNGVLNKSDGTLSFGNNDCVKSVETVEEGLSLVKSFLNHNIKTAKAIKNFQDSFSDFVRDFKMYCKKEGIARAIEDRIDKEDLTYSCRFLGGFDAWSGDEDICDANILDSKVHKKLQNVCKSLSKDYKLPISYSSGEKAWVYVGL